MMRAVTSASNFHRRFLCPGSERLEAGLSDEDSKDAKEGQLLHLYDADPKLERLILKPESRDLLRISDELDKVVFARVEEHFNIEKTSFEEVREKELWIHKGNEPIIPGHSDRLRYYVGQKVLVIIDKKFGRKVVDPASTNYQLRIYAVAGQELYDSDHVVVAITQPRLPYEERITMAMYTPEDIVKARLEIFSVLSAARKPDAPLHAGEQQCRYCKARTICPEFKRVIDVGLAVVPSLNGELTVAARQEQIERTLAGCSDTQLDKVLTAIQFAGYISDPARDEARKRKTENSNSLPEWKLGKASEYRVITDAPRAISLLSLRGPLTKDEILDCSKPSLTKLRSKIREKTGASYKEAEHLIEDAIGSVMEVETKRAPLIRQ